MRSSLISCLTFALHSFLRREKTRPSCWKSCRNFIILTIQTKNRDARDQKRFVHRFSAELSLSTSPRLTSRLFSPALQHKINEPGNNFPSGSSALVQALLAQRTLEEEKGGYRAGGGPIPSDNFTPSALIQAMLSRQSIEEQEADLQRRSAPPGALAQALLARRRAEQSDHDDDMESLSSSAVMRRVMQRAEEPRQGVAPAGGSSALIQAMLARQQAQNEFDDGY